MNPIRRPNTLDQMTDVTRLLEAAHAGDRRAAAELLPLVYDELRRLAKRKMAREANGHTLQPTALVHEAFLRLVGSGEDAPQWQNRRHFYSAAAEAMRRILIDAARRKAGLKYGGDRVRTPLEDIAALDERDPESLLSLNDALERLKLDDPDSFQVVMLRYFGGLTNEEAAASLGISERTAKRHWSFAKAWLRRALDE
jgi:RNA polymerase sigma factor (TIGR02999 family)